MGRGATCFGPVSRYAGMAASTAGRHEEAIAHYESALETGRRWGAEPFVAVVGLELADALEHAAEAGAGGAAASPASTLMRARIVALRREAIEISRRLELVGLVARWKAVADAQSSQTAAPAPAADPGVPAAVARVPPPANDRVAIPAATAPPAAALAFYRRGDIWTIGTGGKLGPAASREGPDHIERLLGAPQVEFHALDLAGCPSAARASRSPSARGWRSAAAASGDAGPVLDVQAKAAYRAASANCRWRSTRPAP